MRSLFVACVGILFGAGVLPVPAVAFGASTLVASRTTEIVHERPVTASGALAPKYKVRYRYGDASCARPSSETGSAYVCSTPESSANVYDPCWVTNNSRYVICQPHPWSRQVVKLTVTGGYDDTGHFAKISKPWGIRVPGSYGYCLFDPNSVVTVRGHAVHYDCKKRVYLAGAFDTHHRVWRTRAYRQSKSDHNRYSSLGWTDIRVAWLGVPSRRDEAIKAG